MKKNFIGIMAGAVLGLAASMKSVSGIGRTITYHNAPMMPARMSGNISTRAYRANRFPKMYPRNKKFAGKKLRYA